MSPPPAETSSPVSQETLATLTHHLKTQVSLKAGKGNKGSLVIHYNNREILEKIISQLMS